MFRMGLAVLKNFFRSRPRLANSVVYGFLYGGAELSRQLFAVKLSADSEIGESFDCKALGRYFAVGSLINANYLFQWYEWLDRKYVGTGGRTVFKKVLLDQFVMTPPLYVIFYVSMSFLERKENLFEECRTKFVPTFLLSCLFWLPAQTINFIFVPHAGRIVFMGTCSFAWVNVLCWIKAKNEKSQ